MRNIITGILFLSFSISIYSQDTAETLNGTVTFVTSNNVYVRFDDTSLIKQGDTLKLNGTDCLLVEQKSTSSVVCSIINNCEVKKDDTVSITVSQPVTDPEPDETIVIDEPPVSNVDVEPEYKEESSLYKESIRGRASVASYNTTSNLRENRGRFQARFALTADHIGDSKFSIESNLAYRGLMITPADYEGRTSIFNVYNLNVRFDATESLSLTAGRKINPKASSVGANDGLQVEKYFGNFYIGGIGGYRPDFFDYGFNSALLQYGGYLGIETNSADFFSQTTLGAMEQSNDGATDRRYMFFQHNSTIASDLNLFAAMELDIFGNEGATSRLTNLYLSARYRFSRAVNAMISYDSRKRIIYYETFQTEIERLLDDDLARQGLRLRLNVRPAKILWMGASYSSRFQSDQQNQSDNIYAYVTLTRIPKIGGRINVSYNTNSSRYLTSNILSVRHSRDLVKSKLYGDIYFRMADYSYENLEAEYTQNYYGGSLSYNFTRTWQLAVSGEYSSFGEENMMRFYVRLSKRFYSKNNK